MTGAELCERIVKAAKQHGDEESPDYQIGDLEYVLHAILTDDEFLTPEQVERLHRKVRPELVEMQDEEDECPLQDSTTAST